MELKVSASSKVVAMGNCPKENENFCGIMYRMS